MNTKFEKFWDDDCSQGWNCGDRVLFNCDEHELGCKTSHQAAFEAGQKAVDINHLVDRFLCWKLPKDFAPDCGISFDSHNGQCVPVGTNLLTAEQAKQMFVYLFSRGEG